MSQHLTWDELEQVIAASMARLPTDYFEEDNTDLESDARALLRTCAIMSLVTEAEYEYYFGPAEFMDAIGGLKGGHSCWLGEVRTAIRSADLRCLGKYAERRRREMLVAHRVICLWMLDTYWRSRRQG